MSCLEIFYELKRVVKPGEMIIIIEDVDIGSGWDILGNLKCEFDVGNNIRTKEQWYRLISRNFQL